MKLYFHKINRGSSAHWHIGTWVQWGLVVFLLFILFSCTTYYQKTLQFQEYVYGARFDKAQEWLQNDKKGKRPRNLLLHELNAGWVNWITGKNDSSNVAFANADRLMEDQQKNIGMEAVALLTNPTVKPYKPEDFELVLVNYFKAINYVRMQRYEEALVECRKINIKLNQLNDKYKDKKNRYSSDAFAHLLMGLIYDAGGDFNNAFIAYRNSLEAYESVYEKNFALPAPLQLKKDLIRAAYRTGFREEARFYEEKFGLTYTPDTSGVGELLFLWHNGFGPVKDEWSLNFTKIDKGGGMITLADEGAGVSIPYFTADLADNEKSAFSDVHLLRVAFPKYVERSPVYTRAELRAGKDVFPLEMAQNINEIAFKTLQDRMLRELSNALLRMAVKQGMEAGLKSSKKEDMQNLGAAVSIMNALTEKADTRNWQTLPYAISYCRIPVAAGGDSLNLITKNDQQQKEESFTFGVKKGQTRFFVYSTLDSR